MGQTDRRARNLSRLSILFSRAVRRADRMRICRSISANHRARAVRFMPYLVTGIFHSGVFLDDFGWLPGRGLEGSGHLFGVCLNVGIGCHSKSPSRPRRPRIPVQLRFPRRSHPVNVAEMMGVFICSDTENGPLIRAPRGCPLDPPSGRPRPPVASSAVRSGGPAVTSPCGDPACSRSPRCRR